MKRNPGSGRPGTPPQFEASLSDIVLGRLRVSVGRLFQRLKAPGLVKPIELFDQATGIRLAIVTSPYFTKISINGREYYFNRLTGRFDGTGQ